MHNKVNRLQMYLVLALLFFIQLTVVGIIRVFGAMPDLGALFVIFISIFFGWSAGLEAGFVFGLLKDVYSLDPFGVNTISLALTGLVAGLLSPKVFRESRPTQSLIVLLLTLFYLLIHRMISSSIVNTGYISAGEYFFLSFLPTAVYTAVLSLFVFPLFIEWFELKEDAEYL